MLWKEAKAIFRTSPMGRSVFQLREFTKPSHTCWQWRHDEVGNRLLHYNPASGLVDIYQPSTLPGALGCANRWQRKSVNQNIQPTGLWCSVKFCAEDVVAMQGSTSPPSHHPSHHPNVITLLDAVAKADDLLWMWEDLQISGEGEWIRESILSGSCIAVTDGSYMEDLFPDVCLAAFILECQRCREMVTGSFTESWKELPGYTLAYPWK